MERITPEFKWICFRVTKIVNSCLFLSFWKNRSAVAVDAFMLLGDSWKRKAFVPLCSPGTWRTPSVDSPSSNSVKTSICREGSTPSPQTAPSPRITQNVLSNTRDSMACIVSVHRLPPLEIGRVSPKPGERKDHPAAGGEVAKKGTRPPRAKEGSPHLDTHAARQPRRRAPPPGREKEPSQSTQDS